MSQELKFLLQQYERAKRIQLSDDFFQFTQIYFKNQYPPSKYHREIANALMDDSIKHLAIIAPRESAKTTMLQRFILWRIVKKKSHFIVIIAESFDRACDFLRDIKFELENNELLKYDYGNLVGSEWTKERILTSTDIMVSAFSKTSVRGAKYKNYRPDLIVIDDLENEAVVFSSALQSLKQWFQKTVLHLGDYHSRYIMCGTILSKKAILYELTQDPTWHVLFYKAIMKYAERDDLWNQWVKIVTNKDDPNRLINGRLFFEQNMEEMLRGAEVFWKENPLYDYYDLMIQRYVSPGIMAFESEKQNNPIVTTDSLVSEELIQYYDTLPDNLGLFLGVDPSLGITDSTALVVVGKDNYGAPYIIDAITYKITDPMELAKTIIEIDKRFDFSAIGIESVGFQRWLNPIIKNMDTLTGSKLVEVQVASASSIRSQKSYRFKSMRHFILNARFNKSLRMLIDQIITFPNTEHDDLLDALYIAYVVSQTYVPFIVV